MSRNIARHYRYPVPESVCRDSRDSVMTVPSTATSVTPAPSMTPAVPAPTAIIPAVVPRPPKRPIVASVAVIARVVIAAVPRWIVAGAKRENYLRLSRALGCKEQAACCEQNNQRFHALNLMLLDGSRIRFSSAPTILYCEPRYGA
jgi:hypothetical protein